MRILTYHVGKEARHLINGTVDVSNAELEELEKKNYEKGYSERMVGYYDKFYRYNTFDDGASYDRGSMAATENGKCPEECIIIGYNT